MTWKTCLEPDENYSKLWNWSKIMIEILYLITIRTIWMKCFSLYDLIITEDSVKLGVSSS